MTVLLHRSTNLPVAGWDQWVAIEAGPPRLDPATRLAGIDTALESAWPEGAADWLELAGMLAAQGNGAELAHAPACAGNASDLGMMLTWTRLVGRWAAGSDRVLVICDDPWLFRHFAALPGVRAGTPPGLMGPAVRAWLRGLAARLAVSARMARTALAWRAAARDLPTAAPALLVYGHPASDADGGDAYFGALMAEVPDLVRLLHVDCPLSRARALSGPRTAALSGFGSPLVALGLWLRRWRPRPEGPQAWLVRRAATREGATGTPAMIAWQIHCQRRWLDSHRPRRVLWPWENHSWERVFVGDCRSRAIATIGYQHATIGRLELNYHPGEPPRLPDRILCAGPFGRDALATWGVADEVLAVAGAWRFTAPARRTPTPGGAVFVALPADRPISLQMIRAIVPLSQQGLRFVVREHPMTPVGFVPGPGLERATGPLPTVEGIATVLYAGTTVGLEAALAGLPVVRFCPDDRLANDILPAGIELAAAGAANLAATLAAARPLPSLATPLFAAVDVEFWRRLATGGEHG